METIYNVVFQSKSPNGEWEDIETFESLDETFVLSAFDKDDVARMNREFRQDFPKYKTRTINRKDFTVI